MEVNNILIEEYNKISKLLNYDFRGCKFLVTGANGLIGSYLVDYLDFIGAEVYAMSRSIDKLKFRFNNNQNIKLIEQDLNEPLKINDKFDYIIHAASNAHPLAFSQDPVGTMKANLFGTMNLLELAKKSNSKFLYLSSGEIYGNNIDHDFTEDDLGVVDTKIARSCYPESKRAAETLCVSYCDQFGIHTNIARLCYVYGHTITDDNSRADAQFLRNALLGKDIVMKSQGLQRRTYCYVADAVSALLFILLNGVKSEVYNIANPNSIATIAQYAQILANIAKVNLKFELPDEIEQKGYSKQADSVLSAQKLINIGWNPLYNINVGLENTFKIKKELDV